MDEHRILRNRDVDLTGNDLYRLVRENESDHRNVDTVLIKRPVVLKHKKHPQEDEQPNYAGNILWVFILLLVACFLLYLTVYRLGLAGKSLYDGKTMTGLALLSPEIGTIASLGLGV